MKNKLERILLIDDDESTNYYNNLIIEETGCAIHVQVATGGKKALEYLSNMEHSPEYSNGFPCPELIFLDINMPVMSGWEFLDKFRELGNEQKGNTVLIMLTTSIFSEDVLKAKGIPEISGFESKPLSPEIIDRIFKKYFVECLHP